MSEQAPETPAAPAPELEQRVSRIEQGLNQVLDLLKGKGPAHAEAQQATETRLDANSSVAAEVQAELERRDEATKAAEREALVGKHEETLARLTERKPQSPRRKVEEIMGYHG